MTRRMKLILTRPTDDSLEAFENFRRITALKPTQSTTLFLKDELIAEWEKFWDFLKIKPGKKDNNIIQVN